MQIDIFFVLNSALLGVGLAMDAFSVSIANAISCPDMKGARKSAISGVYAGFQFAMPLAGWFCVTFIAGMFKRFQVFIPWIALILLVLIGGNMVREGVRGGGDEPEGGEENGAGLTPAVIVLQGIATSIDALSVGFTIADYGLLMAFLCSLIIAAVTYVICRAGFSIGSRVGSRFSDHAMIFGGVILICIGLEIFIRGMFF